MFWKRKKKVEENTVEETKITVEEKEIKQEDNKLNNKHFLNSIEIKDLELGKTYFRIEVNPNDIDFQRVIILRKGTQLPYNYNGWLLSTQTYNYVVWGEVDSSCYKYNGNLNDLLQENHKDNDHYGPFDNDDTTMESDYKLNKKVAFFDVTSNLNDIKDNITEFWQILADKVLKEKKESYDRQLEQDKQDLIENFNKSLEGFINNE